MCASCGKEQGTFERFLTAGSEFGELEGKKICFSCKNSQIKKETNKKIAEMSVRYDGEYIKVVQIPIMFTEGAWDKIDELCARGYTVKSVVEQELIHASLVILEKTR